MTLFVVERDFAESVSPASLKRLDAKLASPTLAPRESYLAVGGRRALSILDVTDEAGAPSRLPDGATASWEAWTYRMPDRAQRAGHELVAVERRFDAPVHLPDLEAMERALGWCMDLYHVQFLWHYVASDGLKMVCFYDAPDAESVRSTQRTGKMPFERVWSILGAEHHVGR